MINNRKLREPFQMSNEVLQLAQKSLLPSDRWQAPIEEKHLLLSDEDFRALRLFALSLHPRVRHIVESIEPKDKIVLAAPTFCTGWKNVIADPDEPQEPTINTGDGYQVLLLILHLLRRAVGRENGQPVLGHDLACTPIVEVMAMLNKDRDCLDQLSWGVVQ